MSFASRPRAKRPSLAPSLGTPPLNGPQASGNSGRRRAYTAVPSTEQPMRRRKKHIAPHTRLVLESVLGFTSKRNASLITHPTRPLIAYIAGSTVVLYDYLRDQQVAFLSALSLYLPITTSPGVPDGVNGHPGRGSMGPRRTIPTNGPSLLTPSSASSPTTPTSASSSSTPPPFTHTLKTLRCLAISSDGRYLAAGEVGHDPRILVWDTLTLEIISYMQGHRFGVLSLAFSPNDRYIVSVGFQHDGFLCVWGWRQGLKLASNRLSTKVHGLAFSPDGTFCVTVGVRSVKFWYFDQQGLVPIYKSKSQNLAAKDQIRVLEGRAGILGDLQNSAFVDVVCGPGGSVGDTAGEEEGNYTYAVTSTGLLCLFTPDRFLQRHVDLQIRGVSSLTLHDGILGCGGTDGTVRLFQPRTLEYLGSLPRPAPWGRIHSSSHPLPPSHNLAFPSVIALRAGLYGGRYLICAYEDHSLIVWDVQPADGQVRRLRTLSFHSRAVWGVEMMPTGLDSHSLNRASFASYSSDGTVRFWRLPHLSGSVEDETIGATGEEAKTVEIRGKTNPTVRDYFGPSRSLSQVLYINPPWEDGTNGDVLSMDPSLWMTDNLVGVRALRISQDAKYLASGDRCGNLRVHDLITFKELVCHEAHDAEILSIDFSSPPPSLPSPPVSPDSPRSSVSDSQGSWPYLLVSASRDRLVHVFDVRKQFQLVQTLDDHSSSILAVAFTDGGKRLSSCGADKSIIFRSCTESTRLPYFTTHHIYSGRSTINGMDLDGEEKRLYSVGQDRRVHVFDGRTGRLVGSHKVEATLPSSTTDPGSRGSVTPNTTTCPLSPNHTTSLGKAGHFGGGLGSGAVGSGMIPGSGIHPVGADEGMSVGGGGEGRGGASVGGGGAGEGEATGVSSKGLGSRSDGALLDLSVDATGKLAVTCGSDRLIRLHDLSAQSVLQGVGGHSEMLTGVKLTLDGQRALSTSTDGTIFIWKVLQTTGPGVGIEGEGMEADGVKGHGGRARSATVSTGPMGGMIRRGKEEEEEEDGRYIPEGDLEYLEDREEDRAFQVGPEKDVELEWYR
ncbi:WD40-repeat-containing domain protein [Piptocephalis cylindrospora]|uniref:WD40-repeat-containing domain protein n=1 Tax=Piptocephalis cylindrospora TaxID=1907219 RepID=A0A4P9Y6J1_9FUNG|nr:WD40-repeat-containing domain protein [Piptocephalis cylindrospora]|eukprot:RKP14324.1 WD40-repeat-containing domain protein [Piptocephalis cylindrospora]